jgi:hypothetical protein
MMEQADEKTGDERLLRLAEFLDDLPPALFYFGSYVGTNYSGVLNKSCGTTACGLGWATAMPEFQALGLTLSGLGWSARPCLVGDDSGDPWKSACLATRAIFCLTETETDLLFLPSDADDDDGIARLRGDASHSDLAAHIRTFVAERRAARGEA